ncbi:hypothetical protein A6A25_14900 [Saccharothrix sp. CB00851]|nr:hypothetical protein A6A25_14900 [Saccharothrix sp. CB00851]
MVTTVTGGPVPVPPPPVRGQQFAQRGQQVVVAARAGLQHRQARGRVRHPDVQQPVAVHVGQEVLARAGEVVDDLGRAGADLDLFAAHAWRA